MVFDELDKKIIQHLSVGTSSYEELAHQCNVTRNTVYRRISLLQEKGVIKNTLQCIVNLEQMNITAINIGAKMLQLNQDKAVKQLSNNKNVKLLWRTYGDHNLMLVAFASKGCEGQTIQELKTVLEDLGAEHLCVSVGYCWEKTDFSPFENSNEEDEIIIEALTQ
jgi:DNA-binding Lrp family transcriptional regulator